MLLARLRRLPQDLATLAVVGHNPGIRDLTLSLTGAGSNDLRARPEKSGFHTTAVAVLTTPGSWADLAYGAARLEAYWSPHA
ncbi:hypothetical protein [Kitasatospora sp. NPDC050543]|uniref:hypothetical protein n=1 Tax=Kitasatospora sp. NPDC050543 TaxID=3364054 RepID=UPI0037AB132E